MAIVIHCSSCARSLRVEDAMLGRKVRCPNCGHIQVATESEGDDQSPNGTPPPPPPPPPPRKREDNPLAPRSAPSRPPRKPSRPVDDDDDDDGDEDRPWDRPGRTRRDSEPHRGPLIMLLGIFGLVVGSLSVATFCCFPPIGLAGLIGLPLAVCGWVMGARDLRKMRDGDMDPGGQGATSSGMICGIIGTVLSGIAALIGLVVLVFYIFIFTVPLWAAPKMPPPGPPPPPPVFNPPPTRPTPPPTQPKPPATKPNKVEPGDQDYVRVSFAQNGQYLATISASGKVRLLDAKGKEIVTFNDTLPGSGTAVVFSPDSALLVAGGGNRISVWDVNTRQLRKGLIPGQYPRFLGDSNQLAISTGPLWMVVQPDSGKPLRPLGPRGEATPATGFTPDGQTFLIGSGTGSLAWVNASTRREIARINAHQTAITRLIISDDGKRAATLSMDNTVKVWDVEKRQEISSLKTTAVNGLALTADGTKLALALEAGQALIVDAQTGKTDNTFTVPTKARAADVAFSPDGKTLAIVGPKYFHLWNRFQGLEEK